LKQQNVLTHGHAWAKMLIQKGHIFHPLKLECRILLPQFFAGSKSVIFGASGGGMLL